MGTAQRVTAGPTGKGDVCPPPTPGAASSVPGAVGCNFPLPHPPLLSQGCETLFAGRAVHPRYHTFSFMFLNKIDFLAPPALPRGGGGRAPGRGGAAACSVGASTGTASKRQGRCPRPLGAQGPLPMGAMARLIHAPQERNRSKKRSRFGFLSPCTVLRMLLSLCKRQEDGVGRTIQPRNPQP